MIQITDALAIPDAEISEEFIRASGAGGQNVNKVSSAVQLRFDVTHSPSLPENVRERLRQLAGNRINQAGVLILKAQTHRTQERNREEARQRFVALLQQAAQPPTLRRITKPPRSAQRNRLAAKGIQSRLKQSRRMNDHE